MKRRLTIAVAGGFVAIAVVSPGCRKPSTAPPCVKVSAGLPGASAQHVDEVLAGIMIKTLKAVPGVTAIKSISAAGGVELYLTAAPAAEDDALLQSVRSAMASGELPESAEELRAELMAPEDKIPEPKVTMLGQLNLRLTEQAKDHGLTEKDIVKQLRERLAGIAPAQSDLGDILLETPHGSVPLQAVATLERVAVPSHVIRTWPEPAVGKR